MAARFDPSRILSGARVLVTGHTGFKGSWLSAWLEQIGASVAGLSDRVPAHGAFHDFDLGAKIDHTIGDVVDRATVEARVSEVRPELVFHLAAQPLVRRSWVEPVATFAANVMGTVHVVDAALRCPTVAAVVVVTTDKVYENLEQRRAFVETDRLGGHDPYSASKAAAELVLAPYRDPVHLGLAARPLVSVRAGNVIGGGDWSEDRLLPDIVRALSAGETITVRRPDAVRPWQHVLDCVSGYLQCAAAMISGAPVAGAYNFASDSSARTVLEVTTRAVAAWGADDDGIVVDRDDSTAEASYLRLDASAARQDLGWRPFWDVDRAIDAAIAFYRSDDAGGVGRHQIEEHASAVAGQDGAGT